MARAPLNDCAPQHAAATHRHRTAGNGEAGAGGNVGAPALMPTTGMRCSGPAADLRACAPAMLRMVLHACGSCAPNSAGLRPSRQSLSPNLPPDLPPNLPPDLPRCLCMSPQFSDFCSRPAAACVGGREREREREIAGQVPTQRHRRGRERRMRRPSKEETPCVVRAGQTKTPAMQSCRVQPPAATAIVPSPAATPRLPRASAMHAQASSHNYILHLLRECDLRPYGTCLYSGWTPQQAPPCRSYHSSGARPIPITLVWRDTRISYLLIHDLPISDHIT